MKEQPKKSIRLWIARDENYDLYAYTDKPLKCSSYWNVLDTTFKLPTEAFPSVKWEDDEPTRAYLRLV